MAKLKEMELLAEALIKAAKVVDSARNTLELEGAIGYLTVLNKRFRTTFDENNFFKFLLSELIEFSIDTRMHYENKYHKSARTKWETSKVHPNIKDYFHNHFQKKS